MTLAKNLKIEGGKTGHTDLAGYCFAGRFSADGKNKIISAVLGGDDISSRFTETRELVNWVAAAYRWR
jgi:D-alanyl-D-alanine carboxypeptidase (penicillin-binding protein 5/6)